MDPQLQQRLMMFGGLIPGGISLIFLMAAWYLHALRKSRVDHLDDANEDEHEEQESAVAHAGPRWLLPMLLAGGFAGADFAANDVFHLWPDANNYRFTHAIVLIALVGVVEGLVRLPMFVGFVLRVLGFGGAFWMLAEGYVGSVFVDSSIFVGSAIFAALASAIIATAIDRQSEDTPAWVDSISWLIIAGASMPIFLQNFFSTGAMIPAGIIAVLVSTLIVGLIFRDLRVSRGGVTVLVGFMLTMLVGSIIQTGVVNLPAVLLLAASPMVMLVKIKGPSGVKLMLTRLILLGIVLGSSAGLLQWAAGAGGSDDGDGDVYMDGEYSP
jgi:hypothetical protein